MFGKLKAALLGAAVAKKAKVPYAYRHRHAGTGRFVAKGYADLVPNETVREKGYDPRQGKRPRD